MKNTKTPISLSSAKVPRMSKIVRHSSSTSKRKSTSLNQTKCSTKKKSEGGATTSSKGKYISLQTKVKQGTSLSSKQTDSKQNKKIPTKTPDKKLKRKYIPAAKQYNHKRREDVKDEELVGGAAARLVWSPWTLAMAQTKPTIRARGWHPCSWLGGMRFKNMWDRKTEMSAVYEFAAQIPTKKKLYVVYVVPSRGFPWERIWDKYLIQNIVRKEFIHVISSGGRIFARRGIMSDYSDTKDAFWHLMDNFNYAWRAISNRKSKRRDLTKQGFVLSHSKF
ncbi:hypothetical protein ScPMuIL_008776 [Solemya velum]